MSTSKNSKNEFHSFHESSHTTKAIQQTANKLVTINSSQGTFTMSEISTLSQEEASMNIFTSDTDEYSDEIRTMAVSKEKERHAMLQQHDDSKLLIFIC